MAYSSKYFGWMLIIFSLILFIVLIFVKSNIEKQNLLLCQQAHSPEERAQLPSHKGITTWILISAFGVSFLMIITGIYFQFLHNLFSDDAKKGYRQVDLSKLSDEEKAVYNIIKNSNGSAYQNELIKETGFSKVKITRVLDRLEQKDILERKRRGMTNIIVLK